MTEEKELQQTKQLLLKSLKSIDKMTVDKMALYKIMVDKVTTYKMTREKFTAYIMMKAK